MPTNYQMWFEDMFGATKGKTMQKPEMKNHLVVRNSFISTRNIFLHCPNDLAEEFGEFGHVSKPDQGHEAKLRCITVDPRYDFDEVVEYITNYGQEQEKPVEEKLTISVQRYYGLSADWMAKVTIGSTTSYGYGNTKYSAIGALVHRRPDIFKVEINQ